MRTGGLITLLILFPNIPWMIWGAKTPEPSNIVIPRILALAEHGARLTVFLLPFFYRIELTSPSRKIAGLLALLTLITYYGCWARYYTSGWQPLDLGKSLWGIPVPMAVFPVLFLLFASFVLRAWPLGVGAALFGVLHIYISSVTLWR